MVPAGGPTESTVEELGAKLESGDTIIDGGNSFFKDDIRRAQDGRRRRGIHYVDAGTSGGVYGLERGYCLMIGGETEIVQRLDPIFKTLAPGRGDVETHAGPRQARRHRRGGLPALRAGRRRPLRQDGPQRHRVRDHAGHRRGLRHHEGREQPDGRRGASLHGPARRRRRGLAPRQRAVVVAGRSHREGAGRGSDSSPSSPAASRTRARAAGP